MSGGYGPPLTFYPFPPTFPWPPPQNFLPPPGGFSPRPGGPAFLAGRVAVNGEIVRLLGSKVDPAHDSVTVDGQVVRAKKKIYAALHKPVGCVCSRNDELHRPTIYQLLPAEWTNVNSVGRLDFKS